MQNLFNIFRKLSWLAFIYCLSCTSPQVVKNRKVLLSKDPSCKNCSFQASLEGDHEYIGHWRRGFIEAKSKEHKDFLLRDLYLLSNLLESKFEYERANVYQEVLVEQSPGDEFLLKKHALNLIRLGRVERALKYFKIAFKKIENTNERHAIGLLIASLYESIDNKVAAMSVYEGLLNNEIRAESCIRYAKLSFQENPKQGIQRVAACREELKGKEKSEVTFELARFYLQLGKVELAEKYFLQAYSEFDKSSRSLAALGIIYGEQKRGHEIESLMLKHLKGSPDDYMILSRLTDFYITENNYKKAVPYLERMTDLNATDVSLKFKLSFLYRELKFFRESLETLEQVISFNEEVDKAYYFMADIHLQMNQGDIAALYLEKITNESEFIEQTTVRLTDIWREKAKGNQSFHDKYLSFVLKSKGILKNNPESFLKLTLNHALYLDDKNMNKSASDELESIQDFDGFTEAHAYFLASLYEKQKRFESSDSVIKAVLEQDSENTTALNFIGYSLIDRPEGNLEKGYVYLKKALDLKPTDGHILDSVGWYWFKKGVYEKALGFLEKASRSIPRDAVVHQHLGKVYEKMSSFSMAKKSYSTALKKSSDKIFIKEVNKSLSSLSRTPASIK